MEFLWQAYGENVLDRLGSDLLERVRATKATRVVVDGAGGFMAAPAFSERGGPFLAALANELRRLGATTVITLEESEAGGRSLIDTPTLSALADTSLQLAMRTGGSLQRYLSIRKSRVSRCDLRLRELVLTSKGLELSQEGQDLAP